MNLSWNNVSILPPTTHNKPFYVAEHLCVTEELGEVDVENVSGMFDHDVVVVAVTDAEDVRRDTVASAARREVVYRLHTTVPVTSQHLLDR